MRDEVVDICGALALGGSLLRRLGLCGEATRLETLFGAVERRLAESQAPDRSPGGSSPASSSYVSESELTQ